VKKTLCEEAPQWRRQLRGRKFSGEKEDFSIKSRGFIILIWIKREGKRLLICKY